MSVRLPRGVVDRAWNPSTAYDARDIGAANRGGYRCEGENFLGGEVSLAEMLAGAEVSLAETQPHQTLRGELASLIEWLREEIARRGVPGA